MAENQTSEHFAFKKQNNKKEKLEGAQKGWSDILEKNTLPQKSQESKIHHISTAERRGAKKRHSVRVGKGGRH